MTPEQQQELHELSEALRQEFATNEAASGTKAALIDIEDLKPDFLDTLKHLTKHAAKEDLRAKIAMWGYDKLLDQDKAKTDPLRELIEGMGLPADKRTSPSPLPVPDPEDHSVIQSSDVPFTDDDGAQ